MDSLYWLTFIGVGVLSSAASLYFYLRVPYFYFFKEDQSKKIRINKMHFVILTLLAFTLILLFIQPNILDRFAPMINP
jgi:NADH-quinone oxidoreductase subunit N